MRAASDTIRRIWRDLYFVRTGAVWTDDPAYDVVQLRNRIVDLSEHRVAEVTGVTDPDEFYVLAPGDGRYALARVRGSEIVEGCYFQLDWPRSSASRNLQIGPRMLEIRGSFSITQIHDSQTGNNALSVENGNMWPQSRK
jgi:hypothetical protein